MLNAIEGLFGNEAVRKFFWWARYLLFPLLLFPLARYTDPAWMMPGFVVAMVGQIIQVWCFASLVKDRELTERGPYVVVRNPMYLGRYLLILGFVMLPGNWVVVVVYTVVYYFYMVARVKREEDRLHRMYGDSYARYRGRVRRFLPSLGALGNRNIWFFDWAMFVENHAHWNFLLTLGAFAAIYLVRTLWLDS